ncbi:nitrite reductase small subunit NirD [Paenibacillus swuensis]|uniref:nitrite reductase small subunit NirD n=1 Tax=Paenibacillus swuensis TaxID=1178515 RepID=UPI0009EDD1E2
MNNTTLHSAGTEGQLAWYAAVAYEDLAFNTGKTIRCDATEVALFKLSSGTIRAIQNRCPHKDGVLAEGIVAGEHVFCPMHDRKIDLMSGLVQAPDTGCVTTYPVRIEDGQIYIGLPAAKEMAS